MMLLAVLLGCAVLFGPAAAEKVVIHDIVAAQHTRQHQRAKTNPFVSSTVSVTVAPLPSDRISSTIRTELGDAIADFYGRLFAGQDEYDVKIVAVSLLDGRSEYVAGGGTRRELFNVRRQSFGPESEAGGRKLLTNSLQHVKFSRDDDDYVRRNEPNDVSAATEEEGDESGRGGRGDGITHIISRDEALALVAPAPQNGGGDGGRQYALTFKAVVSGEHLSGGSMTHDEFVNTILKVSKKFNSHLVEIVRGADVYFDGVRRVEVGGTKVGWPYAFDGTSGSARERSGAQGPSEKSSGNASGWNTWHIMGVVLGVLAMTLFVFEAYKAHRRKRELEANRWKSRQIAMANSEEANRAKSLSVLYHKRSDDDYSFDPLCVDAGYTGRVAAYHLGASRMYDDADAPESAWTAAGRGVMSYDDAPPPKQTAGHGRDDDCLYSEVPPPMSGRATRTTNGTPRTRIAHAPPGKVGVAIDVHRDGTPMVHKIRPGSALEGSLRPGDRIISIDGVDTTRMCAADVSSLMVRRMNFRRRIEFVRDE